MADLGLDPVNFILMLLRGAAYFFAGFALVGLSIYIVLLCLEIFSPQPRAKANRGTSAGRQPASAAEQAHDLVPSEAPPLAEGATVTRGEVLCEGLGRADCPSISAHQLLGTDTRNV